MPASVAFALALSACALAVGLSALALALALTLNSPTDDPSHTVRYVQVVCSCPAPRSVP